MLQSDKYVLCWGSCSECARWRRLYCCDAVDSGGNSSCKTWFDSWAILLNSSSSAASHSSSKFWRFCAQ